MKSKKFFHCIIVIAITTVAIQMIRTDEKQSLFTRIRNYFRNRQKIAIPQFSEKTREEKEMDNIPNNTTPAAPLPIQSTSPILISQPQSPASTTQTTAINVHLHDLSMYVNKQQGNTCGPHSVKNNSAIVSYLENQISEDELRQKLGKKPTQCPIDVDIEQLYDLALHDTRFLCVGNLGTDFSDNTILSFFTNQQRKVLLDLIRALKSKTPLIRMLTVGKMEYFTQVKQACAQGQCTHCPVRSKDPKTRLKTCTHRQVKDSQGKIHNQICCMCQTDFTQYGHWVGIVIQIDTEGVVHYYYTNSSHSHILTPTLAAYRTEIVTKLHNLLNALSKEQGFGSLIFAITHIDEWQNKTPIPAQSQEDTDAAYARILQKRYDTESTRHRKQQRKTDQEAEDKSLAQKLAQEEADAALARRLEQEQKDERLARILDREQ